MIPDLSETAQVKRIFWRQKLMAIEGGVEWLLHVAKLYNFREKLLGPEHIGLPKKLAIRMYQNGN